MRMFEVQVKGKLNKSYFLTEDELNKLLVSLLGRKFRLTDACHGDNFIIVGNKNTVYIDSVSPVSAKDIVHFIDLSEK